METVTKRQIAEKVSEQCGLGRATVNNVIDTMFDVIGDEVAAGNPVNLTGQLKIGFSATKPIKKGTMVRNPFSGETNPHPGKPAGLRIKVTPGKKLKDRAPTAASKAGKAILAAKK